MDLDPNSILAGMLVSSIGFVLFVYGKKQGRAPQLAFGLLLMIYPYFVPSPLPMLAVAAALLGAFWGVLRLGY